MASTSPQRASDPPPPDMTFGDYLRACGDADLADEAAELGVADLDAFGLVVWAHRKLATGVIDAPGDRPPGGAPVLTEP